MADEHSKLILVVEDEEDLLTLIANVLEAEGFRVMRAKDGCEGLAAITRNRPDLVLLDVQMPVMNGWEFANQLRSALKPTPPIVLLTAYGDPRHRANEIGAVGWVEKPFDLDALVDTVHRLS